MDALKEKEKVLKARTKMKEINDAIVRWKEDIHDLKDEITARMMSINRVHELLESELGSLLDRAYISEAGAVATLTEIQGYSFVIDTASECKWVEGEI